MTLDDLVLRVTENVQLHSLPDITLTCSCKINLQPLQAFHFTYSVPKPTVVG